MSDPSATELWLVRHGESVSNRAGVLQGHEDSPLSELGQVQARHLAERLRHGVFDALYASDLSRASATADTIGTATLLTPQLDPRLREIDVGGWSGLTASQIANRFPEEHARWQADRDPELRRGGGESYADLQRRVAPVFDEIARRHAGRQVLVVCHGGVIRAYLARILSLDLRAIWHLTVDNAAISRVRPFAPVATGGQPRLGRVVTLNDGAHLEPMHVAAARP